MSRWVIHSEAVFEANHALTSYLGEPEQPHSHQCQVAIRVGTTELNAEGYAVDFHAVHAALAERLGRSTAPTSTFTRKSAPRPRRPSAWPRSWLSGLPRSSPSSTPGCSR